MNPYDYYITPEDFEQAAKNGISEVTCYNRVRQLGWTKEKAITTPPRKRSFHNNRWVLVAEKNGICISTYKYRINQLGMTPEEAATKPLQDRKKQADIARAGCLRYPPEILELVKQNGINYDTFRHRINHLGWDMFRAATMPTMSFREIGLMTKEKRKWKLPFSRNFQKFIKGRIR